MIIFLLFRVHKDSLTLIFSTVGKYKKTSSYKYGHLSLKKPMLAITLTISP